MAINLLLIDLKIPGFKHTHVEKIRKTVFIIVLIFDGNSEHVAQP